MLDADLARLYQVRTSSLNQSVKRNADRFPPDFAFQLTQQEFMALTSQLVTSKPSRRPEAAFEDILACRRLAWLVSDGMPSVCGGLVARSMDWMALEGDQLISEHGRPSSRQARTMLKRLKAAPPLPPMAERLHYCERFADLDIVCSSARELFQPRRGLLLYSVGPNGQDNGGRGHAEQDETPESSNWDDLVVRVPGREAEAGNRGRGECSARRRTRGLAAFYWDGAPAVVLGDPTRTARPAAVAAKHITSR